MIGPKNIQRATRLTWMSRVLLAWLLVNGMLVVSMEVLHSL